MSTERISRRSAVRALGLGAVCGLLPGRVRAEAPGDDALRRVAEAPVLTLGFLAAPVVVESAQVLRVGGVFLIRVRSKDGVEAVTVPHQEKLELAYPVLRDEVLTGVAGRDAREVEAWLAEVTRRTYKLQGLLLWLAVAAVEMALLELLAKSANRPLADLFGGAVRRDIPVYAASAKRGNRPEEELDHLRHLVGKSGVTALKFRLGGRMSRNAEKPRGRSEALIIRVREAFGPAFTLYADANSSYDVREAVRIGRLLEEHGYGFYEEPCEFDDFAATRAVTETLTIPVALGEQEFSMNRWRWCVANRVADIMQPDLHYGGGMIRATRVARMAAAAGMTVVPHMSSGGLGYLHVVQFASFTPNIGPHMEFKGDTDLPVHCDTSSLRCETGRVRCPTGPGFGVEFDPAWLKRAEPMR